MEIGSYVTHKLIGAVIGNGLFRITEIPRSADGHFDEIIIVEVDKASGVSFGPMFKALRVNFEPVPTPCFD